MSLFFLTPIAGAISSPDRTYLISSESLLEAFKYAPAIVALLIVIVMLFRLLHKRDSMLERMIHATEEDINRQSKLITLLELIIQRGKP